MFKIWKKQAFKTLSNLHSYSFSKKPNYYQILGLPKTATQADVKKAYAKLAREFHPDKNPASDAKQKFSEINDAYQTLNDEKKRQIYNQTGMTGDEQKQYSQNTTSSTDGFDFSDFFSYQTGANNPYENIFRDFEDIFGQESNRSSKRQIKGADVHVNLEIDFSEAINGATKEFNYKAKDICSNCNGTKCRPGTSPQKCTTCSGKGTVNYRQGPMQIQMGCSSCKTTGTVIKSPCQTCKGSGFSMTNFKEIVNIPKGINSEQSLRVSGKGGIGEAGGHRGDLIIKITVKADSYFKREGFDVYTEIPISICQAVLGCCFDIRTLTGKKSITVSPGTLHGSKVKISGEGITKLAPYSHQRGDHYVIFSITVPKYLTPDQKIVFEVLKMIDDNKGVAPKFGKKTDSQSESEQEKKGRELFQSFESLFTKKVL